MFVESKEKVFAMTMEIQNPCGLELPASLYGGGLVIPFDTYTPTIGEDVFIASNASVIGRTFLGDGASIWFGAVLRGDIAEVRVGNNSNIQDNSVMHVGTDEPVIVGDNVVVGHKAMLHGCTVEDECLIGMGATILNRAVIGRGSIVGAGALVPQDAVIPPYSMVIGFPAKVRRELTEEERKSPLHFANKYAGVARQYRPLYRED